MPKVRWVLLYRFDFVENFVRFPAVQNFENRLRFDKVTESLKVGTFLRHSVFAYFKRNQVNQANSGVARGLLKSFIVAYSYS